MPTSRVADTSSPKGERIVFDDPYPSATEAEWLMAQEWFKEAMRAPVGPSVVIMSRRHEADIHLTIPPERG